MPGTEAKNENADFIHIRQASPEQFERYTTQEFGKGIKARLGWKGNKSTVQVVMFDKKHYTEAEAKEWIKKHPEFHLSESGLCDDGLKLSESHFITGSTRLSEEPKWFMCSREYEKDENGIILTEKMFDDFVRNFKNNVVRCSDETGRPILDADYEHKEDPKYGLDAAGWIEDVEKRILNEDGKRICTLWMKPKEWTPTAQEAIRTGAKKFFSIEYKLRYKDRETGKVYDNVLLGGGLTNRPYIHGLPPVALTDEAVKNASEENKKNSMKGVSKMVNEKLRSLLAGFSVKLSEDATDEYIAEKVIDFVKQLAEGSDKALKLAETLKTEKEILSTQLSETKTKLDAAEAIALSEKKKAADKALEKKMTVAELKDEKHPIVKLLSEKKYDDVIALAEMLPVKLKEEGHEEPEDEDEEDGDDGEKGAGNKKSERLWDELDADEKVKKTQKHMEKPDAPKKFAEAAAEAKRLHNDKVVKAREKTKEAK
jgi:hypothetical protein